MKLHFDFCFSPKDPEMCEFVTPVPEDRDSVSDNREAMNLADHELKHTGWYVRSGPIPKDWVSVFRISIGISKVRVNSEVADMRIDYESLPRPEFVFARAKQNAVEHAMHIYKLWKSSLRQGKKEYDERSKRKCLMKKKGK